MTNIIGKLAVGVLGVGMLIGGLLIDAPKPNTLAIQYSENQSKTTPREEIAVKSEYLSSQAVFLLKLRKCESGNNDLALNPKDLDGTESLGRYQFKRKTWEYFVKNYDLFGWQNWDKADWENSIWDGQWQEQVLWRMLKDKSVDWRQQFPTCVKLYGQPPK